MRHTTTTNKNINTTTHGNTNTHPDSQTSANQSTDTDLLTQKSNNIQTQTHFRRWIYFTKQRPQERPKKREKKKEQDHDFPDKKSQRTKGRRDKNRLDSLVLSFPWRRPSGARVRAGVRACVCVCACACAYVRVSVSVYSTTILIRFFKNLAYNVATLTKTCTQSEPI